MAWARRPGGGPQTVRGRVVSQTLIFRKTKQERAETDRAQGKARAPGVLNRKVSAVVRNADDAANLAHRLGGSDAMPFRPVLVDTGDSRARRIIVGDGEASAAELQDLALKATTETKRPDFDALRERHGLMRREDVRPAIQDALRRRAQAHIDHPVTDPARVPGGPREKHIW